MWRTSPIWSALQPSNFVFQSSLSPAAIPEKATWDVDNLGHQNRQLTWYFTANQALMAVKPKLVMATSNISKFVKQEKNMGFVMATFLHWQEYHQQWMIRFKVQSLLFPKNYAKHKQVNESNSLSCENRWLGDWGTQFVDLGSYESWSVSSVPRLIGLGMHQVGFLLVQGLESGEVESCRSGGCQPSSTLDGYSTCSNLEIASPFWDFWRRIDAYWKPFWGLLGLGLDTSFPGESLLIRLESLLYTFEKSTITAPPDLTRHVTSSKSLRPPQNCPNWEVSNQKKASCNFVVEWLDPSCRLL